MTPPAYAWLAYTGSMNPIGLFSEAGKARKACQDMADGYFGAELTERLAWKGSEKRSWASHHDPGLGNVVFQVDRFTVDEAL